MENVEHIIAREVIPDRLHFSFAQNFRRAARIIGFDFIEDQEGEFITFLALHKADVQTLIMLADAS